MRRLAVLLMVTALMTVMLGFSASLAIASEGKAPCGTATGLATAHEAVPEPEDVPGGHTEQAHNSIPCNPD